MDPSHNAQVWSVRPDYEKLPSNFILSSLRFLRSRVCFPSFPESIFTESGYDPTFP